MERRKKKQDWVGRERSQTITSLTKLWLTPQGAQEQNIACHRYLLVSRNGEIFILLKQSVIGCELLQKDLLLCEVSLCSWNKPCGKLTELSEAGDTNHSLEWVVHIYVHHGPPCVVCPSQMTSYAAQIHFFMHISTAAFPRLWYTCHPGET